MRTKPREEPVDLVIKLDFIYCNLTNIHLIKMIFYILKGFYSQWRYDSDQHRRIFIYRSRLSQIEMEEERERGKSGCGG